MRTELIKHLVYYYFYNHNEIHTTSKAKQEQTAALKIQDRYLWGRKQPHRKYYVVANGVQNYPIENTMSLPMGYKTPLL